MPIHSYLYIICIGGVIMKTVYILKVSNDDISLPYSYDEHDVYGYANFNEFEPENYKVMAMTEEVFENFSSRTGMVTSEIVEYAEGIFITEDDLEFINTQIDNDITSLMYRVEELIKDLKCFKGDDVKTIRKLLKKLINKPDIPEKADLIDMDCLLDDEEFLAEEPFYVLQSKIDIKKYLNLAKYSGDSKKKKNKLIKRK